MNRAKYIYRCCCCGKEYDGSLDIYLCPPCSRLNQPEQPPKGVLKVIYDYDSISRNITQVAGNGYIDLLPIRSLFSLPQLRVGKTPLYRYTRYGGKKLPFTLLLKDDSQNPTFSFKDRLRHWFRPMRSKMGKKRDSNRFNRQCRLIASWYLRLSGSKGHHNGSKKLLQQLS
jgi:threonine synthase